MGLIKAALGAGGGVLADQWREYFYCDALPADILATKGQKRVNSSRSSNTKGSDNIISNGSIIAVADGQCMLIVEQGAIVEFSAEPGQFVWDSSTEPTVFFGGFGQGLQNSWETLKKRFTFGGDTAKDQRVYYFNTKEIIGNKYGTASPVPFRVVDSNIGLDIDIAVRCFGEYSYKLTDPMLFYKNVCGNLETSYNRVQIDSQLKSEFLTALQPAFARISAMGVRYSAIPGHTGELSDCMNQELSAKWSNLRGISVVSVGVNSIKASDEDEARIKDLQAAAALRNPNMAAATLAAAQAQAMRDAAKNEGGMGAMGAFMGMNMAGAAGGMNAGQLFQMGQQQAQAATPAPGTGWKCPACGSEGNSGNFCSACGGKKPAPPAQTGAGWKCPACGAEGNRGKFCGECGQPKPAGVPQYKCDKCGWEPEDRTHLPKFCPECGDPFDDGDIK